MKVENLELDERLKQDYINSGIVELNPPQQQAVEKGLLEGEDLIVASPTASGKTFIAELGLSKKTVEQGKKTVYIVPLKALASEKYHDFSERYSDLNVNMSVGNSDDAGEYLDNSDIVIVTSEKMDSMLRHNPSWIHDIGLVVVDEIHLLTSENRGPTLEVTLTRLRELLDFQLLGLSATISNAGEMAEWLDCKLVKSDYRPVELKHGVYWGNEVEFFSGDEEVDSETESPDGWSTGAELKDENDVDSETLKVDHGESRGTLNLLIDTLEQDKQAIIFCNSRKGAEKESDRAGRITKEYLSREEKKDLEAYAEDIITELGSPTSQCKRLAKNMEKGSAFHHAGILPGQRKVVEEAFRKGLIQSVSATPTLCLSGDTEIWTDGENRKVKDLSQSDNVLTLQCDDSLEGLRPEKVVENLNTSKLIRIESVSGRSIKVTPNHDILIKRDNKRKILPAKDLQSSDKIATVGKISLSKHNKPRMSDFVEHNDLPVIDRVLDKEDFFFIGAMLGDGYSGAESRNNSIKYKGSADFANSNKYILNRVEKYCKSLDLNPRLRKSSTTDHVIISKHEWFREFLLNTGVEKGENKYISSELLSADKDKIRALLQGLFDTDGWINSSKCIGISSISKQLIKDIQKLLLRFGIVSRVRERKGRKTNFDDRDNFETKKCYELTIKQSKCIRRFSRKVGFTIEHKNNSLRNLVAENTTIHYKECCECNYRIYSTLFSGRTTDQRKWAQQKRDIINFLGENGETGSNKLKDDLGFPPRKNETRLNHHYQLISKRKIGEISPTEWFWSLNDIGEWIHQNIIKKQRDLNYFLYRGNCPICKNSLETKYREKHRSKDFEQDIFWDKIRTVTQTKREEKVYDVVLPQEPENQHLFAANGFLVHNSAGINMPAYRVINRDLKRYTGSGMDFIPVLEYEQMSGRAGRPKYDDCGEAISIAKQPGMKQDILERYILGDAERIQSKLNVEPVLRMHTLALIASKFCGSMDELQSFYEKTFYAYQFGNLSSVEEKIEKVVKTLEEYGFVDVESFEASKIGRKVSDLYIDPDSAYHMIQCLERAEGSETRDISYLFMLSRTSEIRSLNVKNKELSDYDKMLMDAEPYLLESVPEEWDIEYEKFVSCMKTAMMMNAWASEMNEERIMNEFGTAPGGIRAKMQNADWLLYSCKELARMKDLEVDKDLERLRIRLKHGIKEELLTLVKYDQIGRVRARKLYDSGIRNQRDIKDVNFEKLKKLIGKSTAGKLKEQVGQENYFDRENIMDYFD